MKFVISYSGGKDCLLAAYRMIQQGHQPLALVTTINLEQERSWFHGIQSELLQAVSESLGLPVLLAECTADNYNEAFERSLVQARQMGAEACVFGDIDIDEHRTWDEERCLAAGLECLLPLWQEDRKALVEESINAGFVALIKIVDLSRLDESLLGQMLTMQLVEQIVAAGSDACGENGEYHTMVIDGPIFARPIAVSLGEIIDLSTHRAIDISLR